MASKQSQERKASGLLCLGARLKIPVSTQKSGAFSIN
jgi:hypothetical protein